MAEDKILVALSHEEALIFFEWLSKHNKAKDLRFEDQAEQRVLWDIEAILESNLTEPFDSRYEELLAEARSRVRDSTE